VLKLKTAYSAGEAARSSVIRVRIYVDEVKGTSGEIEKREEVTTGGNQENTGTT